MTSTTAVASPTSDLLREATRSQHRTAETRGFITRLMGGELTLSDYVKYLAQLAYVYEALESRESQEADPALLLDTRLHRLSAVEADLQALGAADWRAQYPALPGTVSYVERIVSLPTDSYVRYLAHHYTRYLGDLSGGQAIGALVRRHYGATKEQTTFYDFTELDNLVQYKRDYRTNLDGLTLADGELSALVEEAQIAFALNTALFEELGEQSTD